MKGGGGSKGEKVTYGLKDKAKVRKRRVSKQRKIMKDL